MCVLHVVGLFKAHKDAMHDYFSSLIQIRKILLFLQFIGSDFIKWQR